MFRKRSRINELLPWYVNGTLPESERLAVERHLQRNPEAVAQVETYRRLRQAIGQMMTTVSTSEKIYQKILQSSQLQRTVEKHHLHPYALGLALVILTLLWAVIRPGVMLQWSPAQGKMSEFHVYRAAQGQDHFDLLEVVPAREGAQRYTYVDVFLLPWQSYSYRVEGVNASGVQAISTLVTHQAIEILPGQLALLITSLTLGYSLALALQPRLMHLKRGRGILPA